MQLASESTTTGLVSDRSKQVKRQQQAKVRSIVYFTHSLPYGNQRTNPCF